MDAIEALVRSLPAEADRIRRRFWRDPEFRTVCEDYRDLLLALAALETGPSADAGRPTSTGSWPPSCSRRQRRR